MIRRLRSVEPIIIDTFGQATQSDHGAKLKQTIKLTHRIRAMNRTDTSIEAVSNTNL